MTLFSWNRRRRAAAAMTAAFSAATILAVGGSTAARAQAPNQKKQEAQAMAGQAKMLKEQFGFSSAQVKKFQDKQMVILGKYRPKLEAIQKKHGVKPGVRPTQEQQQKMMPELQPVGMEMVQKMQAALMETATPAQREKIKKMQAGGPPQGRPAPKG